MSKKYELFFWLFAKMCIIISITAVGRHSRKRWGEYTLREILFSERNIRNEEGQELYLRYYITVNDICREGSVLFESYGVKIVMVREDGKAEAAKIDDIFVNLLEINELVMVLSRCSVTPVSLYEIMDDYLAG